MLISSWRRGELGWGISGLGFSIFCGRNNIVCVAPRELCDHTYTCSIGSAITFSSKKLTKGSSVRRWGIVMIYVFFQESKSKSS